MNLKSARDMPLCLIRQLTDGNKNNRTLTDQSFVGRTVQNMIELYALSVVRMMNIYLVMNIA